jgi:MFS family permease
MDKVPRTVWALGLVSLFMDLSSEIIHALLPLFLTTTLGVSVAVVGLIDGIAEATASISKVFSGYVSDRIGRRKPLILMGYGLGALSKPLFAMAGSASVVLGARFADRIGKGLRGAPRDALVADVTPEAIRGRAFGLRQSLDTVGAFTGPLLAIALMAMFANDMRSVFWIAVIPGALAVACVIFGVEELRDHKQPGKTRSPVVLADLKKLDRAFWMVVAIGVVFTLARFSEAFLILKASDEGLPLTFAPAVLIVMNIVYALGAYPAGVLSDRYPAPVLLGSGLAALVLADLALALWQDLTGAFAGIALWGMHMGKRCAGSTLRV